MSSTTIGKGNPWPKLRGDQASNSQPIRQRLMKVPGMRNVVIEQTWELAWKTQVGWQMLGAWLWSFSSLRGKPIY